MYNTVETFAAVRKHYVAKTSPRSALPKDTDAKVDKDVKFHYFDIWNV